MLSMQKLTPTANFEGLGSIFKLLSDGTRLRILSLLANGERNVGSLCQELSLPQPTVSHHLGLLRVKNIIMNRRDGKQVYYGLDSQVISTDDLMLEIRADGFVVRVSRAEGLL